MEPIDRDAVQAELSRRTGTHLYLHLETSTGAYAGLQDKKMPTVAALCVTSLSVTNGGPSPARDPTGLVSSFQAAGCMPKA